MRFHVEQADDTTFSFQLLGEQDSILLTSPSYPSRDRILDAIGEAIEHLDDDEHLFVTEDCKLQLRHADSRVLASGAARPSAEEAAAHRTDVLRQARAQRDYDITLATVSAPTARRFVRWTESELVARYAFALFGTDRISGVQLLAQGEEHTFRIHGESGEPILFAGPYGRHSDRLRVIRSALKASSDERRFEIRDDHTIVLESRNGQELMRSRPMESRAAAEAAVAYLVARAPKWGKAFAPKKRGPVVEDYELSLASGTGAMGPEALQASNGRPTFLFNDDSGKPFLFGQAYSSTAGRDNGIRSVIRNSMHESRYREDSDEHGRFISLRAGNGQVVARSRYLAAGESMAWWIDWLQLRALSWAEAWKVDLGDVTIEHLTRSRSEQDGMSANLLLGAAALATGGTMIPADADIVPDTAEDPPEQPDVSTAVVVTSNDAQTGALERPEVSTDVVASPDDAPTSALDRPDVSTAVVAPPDDATTGALERPDLAADALPDLADEVPAGVDLPVEDPTGSFEAPAPPSRAFDFDDEEPTNVGLIDDDPTRVERGVSGFDTGAAATGAAALGAAALAGSAWDDDEPTGISAGPASEPTDGAVGFGIPSAPVGEADPTDGAVAAAIGVAGAVASYDDEEPTGVDGQDAPVPGIAAALSADAVDNITDGALPAGAGAYDDEEPTGVREEDPTNAPGLLGAAAAVGVGALAMNQDKTAPVVPQPIAPPEVTRPIAPTPVTPPSAAPPPVAAPARSAVPDPKPAIRRDAPAAAAATTNWWGAIGWGTLLPVIGVAALITAFLLFRNCSAPPVEPVAPKVTRIKATPRPVTPSVAAAAVKTPTPAAAAAQTPAAAAAATPTPATPTPATPTPTQATPTPTPATPASPTPSPTLASAASMLLPSGATHVFRSGSSEAKLAKLLQDGTKGSHTLDFDAIRFTSGSHFIDDPGAEQVWLIGELLKRYPNASITVNGYRTSSESPVYTGPDDQGNRTMSLIRAECVTRRLTRQGVPASRVTAKGLADAISAKRVEFVITIR